jgi:hypothetical protein
MVSVSTSRQLTALSSGDLTKSGLNIDAQRVLLPTYVDQEVDGFALIRRKRKQALINATAPGGDVLALRRANGDDLYR